MVAKGIPRPKPACALILLAFAFCTFTLAAKEKQHLPLPATVLAAKTVFIDNQTGMAKLGDRAYEELKKWGRFSNKLTDRKHADLIFQLTAQERDGGYVTTGGGQDWHLGFQWQHQYQQQSNLHDTCDDGI